MFAIFISLILFDLAITFTEFSYYGASVCDKALKDATPILLYLNLLFTTIIKLIVVNLFYLDIKYRDRLPIRLPKPILLPACVFGVSQATLMPLYVFDYSKCLPRHPFLTIRFAGMFAAIVTGVYIIFMIIGGIVVSVHNKDVKTKSKGCKSCYDLTIYTGIGLSIILTAFSLAVSLGNFS